MSTIETLSEVRGNKMHFNNLQNPSSNVKEILRNQNRKHFLRRQSYTEQQIEQNEKSETGYQSETEEEYFDSLSTQLIDTTEVDNTTANDSVILSTDSRSQSEQYESLKKQLQDELNKYEINDIKELEKEIGKKKQVIQDLVKQGRNKLAKRRGESLSKLEELQLLADKISAFEHQQAIDNLEKLKAKLASGLLERDVRNEKELKEDIMKKKQEIETLEKRGKHKTVMKRQESLSTLEYLLELFDKIKVLEPDHSIDNPEYLKTTLISGLLEHDIFDEKQLEEKIMNRKQEIETLKNEGKYETAVRRRNSLSELEELQVLTNKIRALQTINSNKNNEVFDGVRVTDRPDGDDIISERREEDTITKERVRNLYNDFVLMPPCAEKSLINLLFLIALKLIDETVLLENNIMIPDEIETEIAKEVQCLNERLKIEEFDFTQVKNFMGTISVNVTNQNWKCAFNTLEKVLKLIRPINIPELFRLFDKVDETARLINGEDIILLLGGTGTGKSTTIHFLGGSRLKEITVAGLNHIHPVEIRNPDLKKIITTPFARSETRCIIPVRLCFKDIGGCSNASVLLCDSPGFEDTSGPEVDVANGFGTVNAIRGCKSVRPVVLISYQSIGDRLGGIKNLAHTLGRLIPNIRDHISTFSYIFTKFPHNEKDTICALLTNLKETLNEDEKSHATFISIFTDMVNKTRQGARTLDPIHDDAFEILHELAESKAITYPDEAFQHFITEKSKVTLNEQVRSHQLSIISANKRYDYLFAKYKLDQLKRLNDILNQEYIKQIYDESIRHISKHLSQEYEEGTSFMNRCLMSQTIVSNEDIQHYQIYINHAKLADELRESHLGKEVIHSSAFIQNINQQIEAMVTELRKKEINDSLVKLSLDKIKLVSNSFSDIDQEKYKNICKILYEKFQLVINSFKSSVLSNEFDETASNITKLHQALTVLRNHLDYEDMKAKYVQVKEYFINYLNDSTENINYIFYQEKLNENDMDSLNKCIGILENTKNTFTLQLLFSKEVIDNIYENLLSKILNYFEKIVKKINTEFEKENAFHTLEQFFIELDSLRTISIIELTTTQSYYILLEKIIEYLHYSQRNVEQLLRILFQREEKIRLTWKI
ncbi:unnamed protein product [Rotaria sp. Silwood1]|nr:unnamed protein product [Rotaria sp. Silwood1]